MSENANAIMKMTSTNEENEYSSEDVLLKHLEEQLALKQTQIEELKSEYEKIGNPENLVKVIEDEIWEQFKNQLGLDVTNESLIQEYKRKNPAASAKERRDAVMQDPVYRKANAEMKAAHQRGELIDSYTGKKIDLDTKPNLDHVISRKEIDENDVLFMMSGKSLSEVANMRENLEPTNESLNKSKGATSIPVYVAKRQEREASLKEQNKRKHEKIEKSNKSSEEKRREHEKADKYLQDKLDADDARMMEKYKRAKRAMQRKTLPGAVKRTVMKAGRDALKTMAISALFDLLKSIMNGLVRFLKEKEKSWKRFMEEIKASIVQFLSNLGNVFKTGMNNLIGTIISQIADPIFHVFKKFASLIKQGFSSFMGAIRYLRDPKNKGKSLGIKIAQIGKIVTAGFAAGLAIVLGEVIEKVLMALPMMTIAIPGLGTLASITGVFLASVISGVIGAISLNLIDRWIAGKMRAENQSAQLNAQNSALITAKQIGEIKEEQLKVKRTKVTQNVEETIRDGAEIIKDSISNIVGSSDSYVPGHTPNATDLDHLDEDIDQQDGTLETLEEKTRGDM